MSDTAAKHRPLIVAMGRPLRQNASTERALRVAPGLHGWNRPIVVTINMIEPMFDIDGACILPKTEEALQRMTRQVVDFARVRITGTQRVLETMA